MLFQPDTVTENGDPAYSSAGFARLDFFSNIVRGSGECKIHKLLDRCWNENPLDTLKLIFYKRNCRGIGSGEKRIFEQCYDWLFKNHPTTAIKNLQHIPTFGYWKDLLKISEHTPKLSSKCYDLFANQLIDDVKMLTSPSSQTEKAPAISLCAKWAPSLKLSHDLKHNSCQKIFSYIKPFIPEIVEFGDDSKLVTLLKGGAIWEKKYRTILSRLRAHLKVVERLMSENNWDKIEFGKVPSVAMKNYRNAFKNHSSERFAQYLADVKSGKEKINSQQLHPHEIVSNYPSSNIDEVLEAQWNSLVNKYKDNFKHVLTVCDFSGSMAGIPINVSMALGILISQCVSPPFENLLITFSQRPSFFDLSSGKTLYEKKKILSQAVFYENTDLVLVFKTILERSLKFEVKPEDMPEKIIILTDMQFDSCTGVYNSNTYATIKKLYSDHNYTLPKIVFWNLRCVEAFPVTKDEIGVCLVSGFSPSILKNILNCEDMTPMTVMRDILDDKVFECLEI
jgi:hypothetical protein